MSESSLRSRVVEAGARAAQFLYNEAGVDWEDETDKTFYRGASEAVFDAFLSCLTENGMVHIRYDDNHSTELQALSARELIRLLRGAVECRHDWYRGVSAPPDVCLKCGAEEDRG